MHIIASLRQRRQDPGVVDDGAARIIWSIIENEEEFLFFHWFYTVRLLKALDKKTITILPPV